MTNLERVSDPNDGAFSAVRRYRQRRRKRFALALGVCALAMAACSPTGQVTGDSSSTSTSASTSTSTSIATTTSTTLAVGVIPAAELASMNELYDRGMDMMLEFMRATPEDSATLAAEAAAIKEAWLALAESGSAIGREAYRCKAAGFEKWAEFFEAIRSGDGAAAMEATVLAEEFDVRGSYLLDEMETGESFLPPGSPRTCP